MRARLTATLATAALAAGAAAQEPAPTDTTGPPARPAAPAPAVPATVPARGVPADVRAARSPGLPLESCLQDAARLARRAPLDEVRRAVGEPFVRIADDGLVHVEVVGPHGQPPAVSRAWVAAFGGRTDSRWGDRLDAWVPLDALIELAATLPAGHRVERAGPGSPDQVAGEGPAAIGSDVYRDGGADGTGRVVAVIDAGYSGLTAARANGDAPALAASVLVNYTPFAFEADGPHGTGCVEAAFDHVPGATWRLYKIDSLADMGLAVADAVANGADVITHSLSRYNLGWADDSGAACAAALQAAWAGVPFLTSAGNRAQQHHQAVLFDSDGDGWHEFSPADETIDITMPALTGGDFYLSWDTGAGAADYDLQWDGSLSTLLASSTNTGSTFEAFSWANTTASAVSVHLSVKRISGASVEFELFEHGGGTWNEYVHAQGSTTSPSNASHPDVLSVGAVPWGAFPSPAGTSGLLAVYSSRGPSNSGATLPDLVGPTDTQGFTYPATAGGFGGTSAATPNVAGALCALGSSAPTFGGAALGWLALEQGRLHRDWGAPGPDDLYGAGGASLAPFAPDTRWLARGYGNTANLATGPYYTLAAAYAAVPAGGRVLALPGSYPEAPLLLTKACLVEGWEGSALLGP